MKHMTRILFMFVLLVGTTAIFASEPSIRISFPQDGELVDCNGFFIVAHAEDIQRIEGEDEVLLQSKVTIIEEFVEDTLSPIEHIAEVNPLSVVTSDSLIEAIKPDAKDMVVKLYKPRKLPLVTHFECTDAALLEKITIFIDFSRANVDLPTVSISVEPQPL